VGLSQAGKRKGLEEVLRFWQHFFFLIYTGKVWKVFFNMFIAGSLPLVLDGKMNV